MKVNYIELVGLPGAGKTEVAKNMLITAESSNFNLKLRKSLTGSWFLKIKLFLSMCFLLAKEPSLISLWFLPIKSQYRETPHVQRVKRDLVTRLIIDTVVIRYLLHYESQILLNDEGLITKLVSLVVLTNLTEDEATSLIFVLLPYPANLIFIDVDPIIAMAREKKRNIDLPFFNDMDNDTRVQFFESSASQYTRLATAAEGKQSIQVTKVKNDNQTDLSSLSEYLINSLQSKN